MKCKNIETTNFNIHVIAKQTCLAKCYQKQPKEKRKKKGNIESKLLKLNGRTKNESEVDVIDIFCSTKEQDHKA